MRRILDWFVEYLCRWLPRAAPTGLYPVGRPDRDSPVLVTANFSLTVKRVKRALRGQNLWLLVANSKGINVWCAAGGGLFDHNSVIDAVKISRLAERVDHRRLVLPALSAPAVDLTEVEGATGFSGEFGPVDAGSIPDYLNRGEKTEAMRRFDFGLRYRLDMFFSMNTPVYLVIGLALAAFDPGLVPRFTLIFWSALAILYLFIDIIPGRSGWAQAFFGAAVWVGLWGAMDWVRHGSPLVHWAWLIAVFAIFLAAGLDLAGTASPRKSDAERLLGRFRRRKSPGRKIGSLAFSRPACIGCGRCFGICPIGVFGPVDEEGKAVLLNPEACFACRACVKQCPANALSLADH